MSNYSEARDDTHHYEVSVWDVYGNEHIHYYATTRALLKDYGDILTIKDIMKCRAGETVGLNLHKDTPLVVDIRFVEYNITNTQTH